MFPTDVPSPLTTGGARPHWGPITQGAPIEAPVGGDWEWVEFPEARCMNGDMDLQGRPLVRADGSRKHTGIAVRRGRSDRLIIYMQAGNACANKASCDITANRDGYYREEFEAYESALADGSAELGLLRRDEENNPFADWSQVFIPYCSGDWFTGDNPVPVTIMAKAPSELQEGEVNRVAYRAHFQGRRNMRAFLSRIVATFPDPGQIVLSGSSAGGIASIMNYEMVSETFPQGTDLVMLNDSGPLFAEAWVPSCMQSRFKEMWRLDRTLPEDCEGCEADAFMEPMLRYLQTKYPDSRMGYVWSAEDSYARMFLGFGLNECERRDYNLPLLYRASAVRAGAEDVRDRIFGPNGPARVYMLNSSKHIWLRQDDWWAVRGSGLTLGEWVERLIDADPTWNHHRARTGVHDPSPHLDAGADIIAEAQAANASAP